MIRGRVLTGIWGATGLDLYLYKGVTKNRHISTGAPCCMPRLRPYWGCSTGLKPRLNHQSFVMLFTNKPPPLTARFNAGEEEGRDTISRVEPRIRHVVLATCSISVLSTSKRLEIERILVVDNSIDRFRFENQWERERKRERGRKMYREQSRLCVFSW